MGAKIGKDGVKSVKGLDDEEAKSGQNKGKICPLLKTPSNTATFGMTFNPKYFPGVLSTRVGYSGGTSKWPTYRSIGDHTEVIQVTFDPERIKYSELLDIFFEEHNFEGKTVNQYRSGVWYQDSDQKKAIQAKINELNKSGPTVIVNTHVAKLGNFYYAEEYHQNFFEKQGR